MADPVEHLVRPQRRTGPRRCWRSPSGARPAGPRITSSQRTGRPVANTTVMPASCAASTAAEFSALTDAVRGQERAVQVGGDQLGTAPENPATSAPAVRIVRSRSSTRGVTPANSVGGLPDRRSNSARGRVSTREPDSAGLGWPPPVSVPLGDGEAEPDSEPEADGDPDWLPDGDPDGLPDSDPDWLADGDPDCGDGDPDCGGGEPDGRGGGLPEPPVGGRRGLRRLVAEDQDRDQHRQSRPAAASAARRPGSSSSRPGRSDPARAAATAAPGRASPGRSSSAGSPGRSARPAGRSVASWTSSRIRAASAAAAGEPSYASATHGASIPPSGGTGSSSSATYLRRQPTEVLPVPAAGQHGVDVHRVDHTGQPVPGRRVRCRALGQHDHHRGAAVGVVAGVRDTRRGGPDPGVQPEVADPAAGRRRAAG